MTGRQNCRTILTLLLSFVVLALYSCSNSESDNSLSVPNGLNVLWVGTSIPEGCSYPAYACRSIGAKCINKSVGASFLCQYDVDEKGIEYAGLSLTETIAEKEERYVKYVKEGKLSAGKMLRFRNSSFENLVLPYVKWADVIVIDHGYNDDISLYKLYEARNTIADTDELWNSMDRSNYIGAYNYLIAEIRKIKPDVKIVVGGYFQNSCTLGFAVRGKYVQYVISCPSSMCGTMWISPRDISHIRKTISTQSIVSIKPTSLNGCQTNVARFPTSRYSVLIRFILSPIQLVHPIKFLTQQCLSC